MNKQPWPVRLLFALGICMATMPLLFKDYLQMPDFLRGGIEGIGIGLELSAFVLMRKTKKSCKRSFQNAEIVDI